MSSPKSPPGIKVKPSAYYNFKGMETNRDKTAMETGENQFLVSLTNCYAHWQGFITNEPCVEKRTNDNDGNVIHINFFTADTIVWAEFHEDAIYLNTDLGHNFDAAFSTDSVITSTVFNRRVIVCGQSNTPIIYDGVGWSMHGSETGITPKYCLSIQGRVVYAGMPDDPTLIEFSRVDDENIVTGDEDPSSVQVTKATNLDIKNLIGTSDQIMGLGRLDDNRMAVFTNDRVLIYLVSPDYTQISIEERGAIRYGTISHNTICEAGGDLIYCSRVGVHALRRSEMNGLTFFNVPLSGNVESLYRELVHSVPDTELISAVYNADSGQYHIFFPINSQYTKRLTLSFFPFQSQPQQGQQPSTTWSQGDFLSAKCGAFLGGTMVIGTNNGVWNVLNEYDQSDSRAPFEIVTPVFWHGEMSEIKETSTLAIQASGSGNLIVQAFDEQGRELSSFNLTLEEDPKGNFPDQPLTRQYERKFEHRYRGVQLRFSSDSNERIKLYAFAINVRK